MNRFASSMIALIATFGHVPGDPDQATRGAFLREYAAASTKILLIYEQIRIDWEQTYDDGRQESWAFARSGPSTRLTSTELNTGRTTVIVANPQHSFNLSREPNAEVYTVNGQAKEPAATIKNFVTKIEVRSLPTFAPYRGYLETPVAEFLADQKCAIKAIALVGAAPNQIVRVDWEMAAADDKHKDRYGTFEFLPDAGWVLKSYSIYFAGEGFKDRTTGETFDLGRGADLEYRGQHDGVGLVHKVTTWTSARRRVQGPTYEVTRIVPGPVPKSEFAIESFPIVPPPAPAARP